MREEAFWFMLSFALSITWSLLLMYFLIRVVGFLVYILIFFVILPLCLIFYDLMEKGKKTTRITFLVVLAGSGSFLGGLHMGLVESMSLADDSLLDISNCVVALHVRNTGLSDIEIAEVTVGDITFDTPYYIPLVLAIGTEAHLIFNYVKETFIWSETPLSIEEVLSRDTGGYTSDVKATPLTFQNGSMHPVTFHTQGLFQHAFSLKAEVTSEEGLDITEFIDYEADQFVEFEFYLNNTGASQCYIHEIQIGDVTFRVKPPFPVTLPEHPRDIWDYPHIRIIVPEEGFSPTIRGSSWWHGEVTAEPTPNMLMFQENETYEVTFWTMTNNYTFNITIT